MHCGKDQIQADAVVALPDANGDGEGPLSRGECDLDVVIFLMHFVLDKFARGLGFLARFVIGHAKYPQIKMVLLHLI